MDISFINNPDFIDLDKDPSFLESLFNDLVGTSIVPTATIPPSITTQPVSISTSATSPSHTGQIISATSTQNTGQINSATSTQNTLKSTPAPTAPGPNINTETSRPIIGKEEDLEAANELIRQNYESISSGQIDYFGAINYYQNKLTRLIRKKDKMSNKRFLVYLVIFVLLMTLAMLLIANLSFFTSADLSDTANLYGHVLTLTFVIILAIELFCILPLFILRFWSVKEGYFLKLELIATCICGALLFIVMATWTNLSPGFQKIYSQYNFVFLMLIVNNVFSVLYPYYKLKNFMVVVSKEDFIDGNHRRTISSFGSISSRFTLKTDDYRNRFVAVLDNPAKYQLFSDCANEYLCSAMILFLDEYQTLKRRILKEFEQNSNLKSAYRTMLRLNNSSESINSGNLASSNPENSSEEDKDFSPEPKFDTNFTHNPSNYRIGEFKLDEPSSSADQNDKFNPYLLKASSSHNTVNDDEYYNQLLQNIPISPTICSSLEYLFPSFDISSSHPVPHSLHQLFKSFYDVFIDPNSELNIGVHYYTVHEAALQIENNEYNLGMFDDAREEILETLYFGVFPRYLESQKKRKRSMKTSFFNKIAKSFS
ncbi:hypothetical protein BB560_000436 [Smittium megazygosporum]|uniref:RGS domain-containing protein n=1 Tax=Smittium megazygosporum TaxID=133381 RepID=A0A2T9ZKD5_9FUNG|nr:hypothetical protein BB560_000436 [Smittium megazygosporum]